MSSAAVRAPVAPAAKPYNPVKARDTFRASFPSDDAYREHMRELARKGNAGRRILASDDVAALAEAYRILDSIAAKYRLLDAPAPAEPTPEQAVAVLSELVRSAPAGRRRARRGAHAQE